MILAFINIIVSFNKRYITYYDVVVSCYKYIYKSLCTVFVSLTYFEVICFIITTVLYYIVIQYLFINQPPHVGGGVIVVARYTNKHLNLLTLSL